MPKPAAHALTWCPDTSTYTVRDPEHDSTLAAIFGGETLTLTPESQEWFAWLAGIPSFAFEGRAGRFTARREMKQRGESYWVAYQRCEGKLQKKYLGRTSDLTAEKLEATANSMSARPASPACADAPAAAPPVPTIAPHAWELIPGQVMDIDIGRAPKAPPYDDTFWLPDRSHFPLVQPTKERCPIHPTARWLLRDPSGQAWCTHPTCWRRYTLMRLGGLINYHYLLGCDRDTFIATGAESWATYASEQDDAHIEFSLRQAMLYCPNLDLQLPNLSEDARLHALPYDAWK
jgi:hypothetical protein